VPFGFFGELGADGLGLGQRGLGLFDLCNGVGAHEVIVETPDHERQMADLAATIDRVPADAVVIATPVDLRRLITIARPTIRVGYELQEIGQPDLAAIIRERFARSGA